MAEQFDIDQLEAACVAFSMAVQLVGVEPSDEWVASCKADDLFAEAPFGMEDEAVSMGVSLMRSWALGLADDGVAEAAAALRREWLRLFVGAGAPDAPIWESYYIEANSPMMSRATIEVRACFREYGMSFARKGSEPDDSLPLMLAFCAHVQGREVEALRVGDEAVAEKCRTDLAEFVAAHILPWMAAWRYQVDRHASSEYYRGVATFVFGLMRCYARRFGVRWDAERQRFGYAAK